MGIRVRKQSTLPAAEPATFGDAFAENRAAGNETFTYNGNLYTTEACILKNLLLEELSGRCLVRGTNYVCYGARFCENVSASTLLRVSYDAFGDAYDTAHGSEADQVAEAQAAAAAGRYGCGD